ncbi:MAG TPA: hypothetical protein VGQ39_13010 [Pyrinomonadaceae bacterium]|jgi:hypothetical protein|nr:hypothetical protein [Pyrinomonadaceae bacterium]
MARLRLVSLNRIVTIVLVICLLSSSSPAAPKTIVVIAEKQRTSWAFWYHSSGMSKFLQGLAVPLIQPQERQSERDAKVVRLEIYPSNVTVDLAERVRFVAVGYDRDGNAVGGVTVRWTAESSTPTQRAPISRHGEFRPVGPVYSR